jgi:hypothetical protein
MATISQMNEGLAAQVAKLSREHAAALASYNARMEAEAREGRRTRARITRRARIVATDCGVSDAELGAALGRLARRATETDADLDVLAERVMILRGASMLRGLIPFAPMALC